MEDESEEKKVSLKVPRNKQKSAKKSSKNGDFLDDFEILEEYE